MRLLSQIFRKIWIIDPLFGTRVIWIDSYVKNGACCNSIPRFFHEYSPVMFQKCEKLLFKCV